MFLNLLCFFCFAAAAGIQAHGGGAWAAAVNGMAAGVWLSLSIKSLVEGLDR